MTEPQVISLGCRLNAQEGDRMRALARDAGLADAVVVNSCAVTGEAVRQSRQAVRRARRANPGARIVVTGCAAQIDPARFAAMPEADAVLGNAEKLNPEDWRALAGGGAPVRVNDIMSVRETAPQFETAYGERSRAFLEVQNGCDHRCTFCIIPYGRGNARSVPLAQAVAAAKRLAADGFSEIVLTGVDLTSWGADLDGAPRLGALVSAILDRAPQIARLRLSSIDGAEIDDALMERICEDARVAPHLHLSLQAGDNLVLKRMKRRHTREQAIELCAAIRARRPEVAFGADLIAGFPTETEEMFQRSIDLVDEAGLQYLHVFPYSPREGTPAALMPQVERNVVAGRARRLREKGAAALQSFLDGLVGQSQQALVETGGQARLSNFAPVRLLGTPPAPGALAHVDLIARDGDCLTGRVVTERR